MEKPRTERNTKWKKNYNIDEIKYTKLDLNRDMFYKKPYSCNYWVTHRCNSKCDYCNVWRDPSLKKIPDAKLEDVKVNLVDLKKLGVKFIDFTGGEPLLNKDLPEMLKYARELGFFTQLTNNGSLYPQYAEEIKDSVSQLSFSFDTLDRDEYKRIRGIDNFDNVLKSIKIAKKLKQNICLICTVTNETVDNLPDIVRFCKENKVVVFIHPIFTYFEKKPLKKEYVNQIKKYFWHPYVRVDLSDLDFYAHGGNDINNPRCKAGKSVIAISPDNCLFVPCFHKAVKKIKINGRLYSLYHSDEWKQLFDKAGRYDFCQGCNIPCYLGASPLDKIDRYFFKELLSFGKVQLERIRS
ncbi:MAG: radical SAM protein [Thermoplasmata archaeon]|nr:MAG: radical SAM protein [Thermoplasmata archaeon]